MRQVCAFVLAATLLWSAACGSGEQPAASVQASTTTAPATTSTVVEHETINVYWAWVIDSVSAGTPERIAAGGRAGERDPETALALLFEGPSAQEAEIGMTTQLGAETTLHGVTVSDGIATADFAAGFDQAGGTLGETMLLAQIVFTLTQFDDIELVRFAVDGVAAPVLGSHGLVVGEGLARSSFDDVRPAILVEQPHPGESVDDLVVLRGETASSVAAVAWELADWDGRIVADGTAATSDGVGDRNRFETSIAVPEGLEGRATLIVFEPGTGTTGPKNIVEYPIWLRAVS